MKLLVILLPIVGVISATFVAGTVIVSMAPYITDMLGEVLVIVGIPLSVAVVLHTAYRSFIGIMIARGEREERRLHIERISLENERLRLDLDILRPDGNILPIARNLITSGEAANQAVRLLEMNISASRTHAPVPQSLTYSVKNDKPPLVADTDDVRHIVPVPQFRDLIRSLGQSELLLGYSDDGPLYSPPHKLKSIVCGGLSGSGKSNTTRFLLAQYAMMGWKLAIFDPHGNSEEGILPSIRPLASSFFLPPAVEIDDGIDLLRCVMTEGERRGEKPNSKPSDFEPLLFVIDEVAEVAAMATDDERVYLEQSLPIILKSFRKFNIFGFCISQFWSRSDMGNLGFLLRRAAQTSIIHRMAEDSSRIIERFADHKEIDNLVTGTCLLNNTDIKRAKLRIPLCNQGDMDGILPTAGSTAGSTAKPTAALQIEQQNIPTMAVGSAVDPAVGNDYIYAAKSLKPSQRMQIENALKSGHSNGQIIKDIFAHQNKTNDRKGRNYAKMVNGVRLDLGMPLPRSPARPAIDETRLVDLINTGATKGQVLHELWGESTPQRNQQLNDLVRSLHDRGLL